MKKVLSIAVSFTMLLSLIITTNPISVYAADYAATVSISTTSPKTIPLGMSGPHNELGGSTYRWDNPELINKINSNENFGYVRINGTNLNAYDWKTGAYGVEALGQLQSDDSHFYGYTSSGRHIAMKGGEQLEDLREFLQRTGAKVIIPVNVFTNTMHQIGNMAKYCYENHISVLYFELGNEVSFYTTEANYNRSERFKTGTDYLERMEAYDREIKNSYPGAKTVVAMDNTRKTVFNEDFKNYSNKFWDAVTTHRFLPDGDTVSEAIAATNGGLNGWNDYLSHYVTNSSSGRIIIGEHSTALSGTLSLTHYNGIAVAESMLRLSMHPNVDYMQSWRIPLGSGYPTYDHKDKLQDAYQRGEVIDTNTLTYDFYDKAPSISTRIVDHALNNSRTAWTTTTTGGAAAPTTTGTMPALYSQAYKGSNGKDYLVIVNKSDKTHDITIKKDGVTVSQEMTRTFVTASTTAQNSSTSQPVYEQTATVSAGSPVFIPAYSVTRVEWIRTASSGIPEPPWLSHADAKSGGVDLRWHKSLNATGYKIKYGTDPLNLANETDVGNVTSYSISGLTNGSTYYFAVAAYNAAGTSAYSNSQTSPSNEVSATLAVPAAPTITRYHYETSSNVVIEWKSVPNAVGYKLKYGTTSGTYTTTIDEGNNLGDILKGLTNGTAYYFVVTAYNAFGESIKSSEVSVTPVGAAPLAPHDLTITSGAGATTSISLAWEKTRTPREKHYFENGKTNWVDYQGTWTVVDHPDTTRATKVLKSDTTTDAVTVFDNVSSGNLEGEAKIVVNSYGTTGQVGIVAQCTNNDNYYKLVYDVGIDSFKLAKRYNSNFTVLATEARNGRNVNDFVLRIEVNGSEITARYGDSVLFGGTFTDSTNTLTGGDFGLVTNKMEAFFDEVRLRKEIGTFNVYRSTSPHLNFTLQASGITGTTWSQSGLNSSQTYYYYVTSTNNGNESYSHSNTVRKN